MSKNNLSNKAILYGLHAVKNALANKNRRCHRLWITKDLPQIEGIKSNVEVTVTDHKTISELTGPNASHQGIAAETGPLPRVFLEDIIKKASDASLIVLLDQITDPHNVGAIMRSAAAFGAIAVVQTEKNSPPPSSPVIAKSAAGAVEHIPLITVTNLARAMKLLKDNNFWCVGLDERGKQDLSDAGLSGRLALVMGSEDKGLRKLTKENCDVLAKLPTNPTFPTLNVSNAAAIGLYELNKTTRKK